VAICTIPLSLSGKLPKYTVRVLGENEPLHGASFQKFQEPARSCFLLTFYAKLSLSSTRVWPVILTSLRLSVGTEQNAGALKDKRATAVAPYLLQNKHYKNSLVNPTYAVASCPLHLDSPVYYWHVTSVFHCFFEYDIITWPDVGSWLEVTMYKWFHPDSHFLHWQLVHTRHRHCFRLILDFFDCCTWETLSRLQKTDQKIGYMTPFFF